MVDDTLAEQGFGKPLICCTVSQQFRGRILAPFCSLILRTAAQVVLSKSPVLRQKVWKPPWAMWGMPCTNSKLLFKQVSLAGQWHPHHQRIAVTYGYSLQSGRYGQFCSCKRRNTELLPSSAKIIRGLAVNWLCRKGWLRRRISFKNLV